MRFVGIGQTLVRDRARKKSHALNQGRGFCEESVQQSSHGTYADDGGGDNGDFDGCKMLHEGVNLAAVNLSASLNLAKTASRVLKLVSQGL